MGLFCKGLHCAGCGKGIPALLIVGAIVLAAVSGIGAKLARPLETMAKDFAVFLIIVGLVLCFIAALTGYAITRAMKSRGMLGIRWQVPFSGQSELTQIHRIEAPEERTAIAPTIQIPAEWIHSAKPERSKQLAIIPGGRQTTNKHSRRSIPRFPDHS